MSLLPAYEQAFGEGREKAGIDGKGGYFRRNHLVPVPSVADLDALNTLLLTGCRKDEAQILNGRSEPIGAAMMVERDHLTARNPEGFDLAEAVRANQLSCARPLGAIRPDLH